MDFTVPPALALTPNGTLLLVTGRQRQGLGHARRHRALAKLVKQVWGDASECQSLLDATLVDAEPRGDVRAAHTFVGKFGEGRVFVSGIHRDTLDVLGEADLGRVPLAAVLRTTHGTPASLGNRRSPASFINAHSRRPPATTK